jgi:hypothetical protein
VHWNQLCSYESFGFNESFQGICFNHVFSKACQYYKTNGKVCRNMKYVFIEYAQANLQKCIIWPKIFGKGKTWVDKTCVEVEIHLGN